MKLANKGDGGIKEKSRSMPRLHIKSVYKLSRLTALIAV